MTSKKIVLGCMFVSLVISVQPLLSAPKTMLFSSGNVVIKGITSDSFIGQVVHPLGDINGDKKPDLFIGAADRSTQRGGAFIMTNVTLQNPLIGINTATVSINGQTINEFIGKFAAGNGDIDHDGKSDLILGDPLKSLINIYLAKDFATWKTKPSTWFRSNFLNNSANTNLSQFLSINGDVNGDGFDDILIGANIDLNDQNPKGRAYLMFGRSDIDNDDLNDLNLDESPSVNIVFNGENDQDGTGFSVAIIPDCNGDGFDDILIGSFRQNGNGTGRQAYLIYGRSDFSSVTSGNVFNLANADAIFLSQTNGTDGFGETVSGLGDINGDGFGDFAIGAPKSNTNQGAVYIFYGKSEIPFKGKSQAGWSKKITGSILNTELGLHAIAGLGDVNGDGINDIGLGEFWNANIQTYAGKTHIILGKEENIPATENKDISEASSLDINGSQANAQTGFTVAGNFDLNHDGINEFIVGARNTNSTKGEAQIFSLATNITPNISSGTLKTFSSSDFSQEKTQFQNLEFIYVQIQGFDSRTSSINSTELLVSSDSQITPISIRLYDSPFHDKKYRQHIQIVQTRSSNKIYQLFAKPEDTIYLKAKDNPSLTATITMANSVPSMTIQSIQQIGTGNLTEIHISYTLFDANHDLISFSQNANQIQYSTNNSSTWKNATLKQPATNLKSDIHGISYSNTNAIVWDAATDLGVVDTFVQLRFKPHDSHAFATAFAFSPSFEVDNLPPAKPTLADFTPKYSYSITVEGTAEPLTTAKIFVNNTFIATTNVDSDGNFKALNIPVSPEQNSITAQIQDTVGFLSPISAAKTVTFAPLEKSFTSSRSDASLFIPINAINTDKRLEFQSENRFTTTPPAPTLYQFIDVFRFLVGGEPQTLSLSQEAIITLNLTFALLTTKSISVMYLTDTVSPAWNTENITITSLSTSQIVFKTKTLGLFGIAQYTDPFDPTIGIIKINNDYIATNKYYSETPFISVSLSDDDSGIASWSITLSSITPPSVITETSQRNIPTSLNIEAALDLGNTRLQSGSYLIHAKAWDNNANTAERYDTFSVDQSTLLIDIVGGPNPYNPNTSYFIFGVNFSQPVDSFEIHLLALNGQHIWDYEAAPFETAAGYHPIAWNGRDSSYTIVPNGAYMAYCITKKDAFKKKTLIRIAVLR